MSEGAARDETLDRDALRVLRLLARGEAVVGQAAAEGRVMLDIGEGGVAAADEAGFRRLVRRGFVVLDGARARLSDVGSMVLKRALGSRDAFGAEHQQRDSAMMTTDTGIVAVTVNHAESPLTLLWRRKGKDGSNFLSAHEYRAGERLRADYSRGCIMPRLGVNWGATSGGGRKLGEVNGVADLTDAALAARQRVEKAVVAVGPELAGVLVDVCCFLKGLERVEAERLWPARSAKVVLKSALAALARHYEPRRAAPEKALPILHWGSEGYRPRIV